MKIIKNSCYGGFSLSPKAVKRYAELKGRECYFFKGGSSDEYTPIKMEEADMVFTAFSIPNPNEVLGGKQERDADGTYKTANELYLKYDLDSRPDDRSDPLLIQVVEELGAEASGKMANLQIVEIPDGIEYEIDEYDGIETIREKHRSW
jgi:hypothetical protein